MIRFILAACVIALIAVGCASGGMAPKMEMKEGIMQEHSESGFWVYTYEGRTFLVGKADTNAAFMKNGHLPITKTIIGGAKDGGTLVAEQDKKDAEFADRLIAKYQSM